MLIHSPAAMLTEPAIAPAIPARRTRLEFTPLPANQITSDTLDTRPSLIPNTPARARPPDTERCGGCTCCRCGRAGALTMRTIPERCPTVAAASSGATVSLATGFATLHVPPALPGQKATIDG